MLFNLCFLFLLQALSNFFFLECLFTFFLFLFCFYFLDFLLELEIVLFDLLQFGFCFQGLWVGWAEIMVV